MQGKRITRRTIRLRRDALTDEARASASEQIASAVTGLVTELPVGSIVALYAATRTEVATRSLDQRVRARGLRVAYPRVVDGERRLSFHEVTIGELASGRFGLDEPRPDAPTVALTNIAVFVIPGLAFDRDGWRVGWGHGYYDATLASAPDALRIGLAFDCQLVENVEHDPHDAHLDVVVTESALYRVPRA
jgi:5-formyltetrahydrofolate cyclo-ligase